MRISDWSSDMCSSDLRDGPPRPARRADRGARLRPCPGAAGAGTDPAGGRLAGGGMKGNFVRRPYHDLGPWPATRLELPLRDGGGLAALLAPLRDENCVERWVACYHLSMTANSPSVRDRKSTRLHSSH